MQILDKDAHKASHAVKLYMLELYCDELMDLLRVDDKKGSPDVRSERTSPLRSRLRPARRMS